MSETLIRFASPIWDMTFEEIVDESEMIVFYKSTVNGNLWNIKEFLELINTYGFVDINDRSERYRKIKK